GGLERHDPAERGGDAHRPATVGAQRELAEPGGDRGRRPAAGSARGEARVVRITGDPGERVVRDPLPRELRGGGLAYHHAPGLADRRGDRGVVGPRGGIGRTWLVGQEAGTPERRDATRVEDVLDR